MLKKNWKIYGVWILFTEAVGGLSAWLTRDGMKAFETVIRKPSLTPPGFVFSIVWGILFALMGIGAARVYLLEPSRQRFTALLMFFAQLAMNFLWSIIFFNLRQYGFALFWLALLWILILGMILAFSKVDKWAALLQIPYLFWVSFAAYLNYSVWVLNP